MVGVYKPLFMSDILKLHFQGVPQTTLSQENQEPEKGPGSCRNEAVAQLTGQGCRGFQAEPQVPHFWIRSPEAQCPAQALTPPQRAPPPRTQKSGAGTVVLVPRACWSPALAGAATSCRPPADLAVIKSKLCSNVSFSCCLTPPPK